MTELQTPDYTVPPALDPERALPAMVGKADVVRWEKALKDQLAEWMADPKSPFDAVRDQLRGPRYTQLAASHSDTTSPSDRVASLDGLKVMVPNDSVFALVLDLRASGALPAIMFNYDRLHCEVLVAQVFSILSAAEIEYRETSPAWRSKTAEFEAWKKAREAAEAKRAKAKGTSKGAGRRGTEDGDEQGKAQIERDAAGREASKWESFDVDAPLAQFSFADNTKISKEELEERLRTIPADTVRPQLLAALRRGLGVHHSGMNRQYRQV